MKDFVFPNKLLNYTLPNVLRIQDVEPGTMSIIITIQWHSHIAYRDSFLGMLHEPFKHDFDV